MKSLEASAMPAAGFMKEGSSVTTTAILLCMFGALFALSLSKKLPWYLARKALHIGTGVIVIYAQAIGFDILIISVGIITLVLIQTKAVKIYPMQQYAVRKDKPSSDVGMLNFTLCTVLCTALGVSLVHISPVYFADPMGAIVGRNVRTPKIPFDGKKTIGGSLAVMFSAIASLMFFGKVTKLCDSYCRGYLLRIPPDSAAHQPAFVVTRCITSIRRVLHIRDGPTYLTRPSSMPICRHRSPMLSHGAS